MHTERCAEDLHEESRGVEEVVLVIPPRHGRPNPEGCQISGHLEGITGYPCKQKQSLKTSRQGTGISIIYILRLAVP